MQGLKFIELQGGAFLSFNNIRDLVEYTTPTVPTDQPWGLYTISANDEGTDYQAVFAAVGEYESSQVVNSSAVNTAQGIPVSANSYRQEEQFVIHTQLEYSTVDMRSRVQAVIRSIKQIQAQTDFSVTLPTGRVVNVKFSNVREFWPFQFGYVDLIIEASEYNPFPILAEVMGVNQRFNNSNGRQGGINQAAVDVTLSPLISQEVAA